jgi:hypothetical protein
MALLMVLTVHGSHHHSIIRELESTHSNITPFRLLFAQIQTPIINQHGRG